MRSLLRAFTSRKMASILLLGFSGGLPLALTAATLQAWMKSEGVDLGVIGLFALVGMPYSLKFAWSPLMDRYSLPFLGRRRGWILLCQLSLAASIAAMAFSSPRAMPGLAAALAFATAFLSASQDIVLDAYRTDVVEGVEELGPAASLNIMGYRVAMLVSGALALILSDHLPWRTVYLLMAGAMGVGVFATLLAPEPRAPARPPRSLREAVVEPFTEFFSRRGAIEILCFILLYRIDVVIATALTTPFMMEIGFTKTDIGAVTKGFGLVATIVGTLAGGALMVRLGTKRSLWFFGLFQGFSNLAFLLLARAGHDYPLMVTSIAVENFCSGMGTAAYSGFLMSQCDKRFTATQFALLTSLMALSRVLASAPTGYLAKSVGWVGYYWISIVAMAPGLLLLTRFGRWSTRGATEAASVAPA